MSLNRAEQFRVPRPAQALLIFTGAALFGALVAAAAANGAFGATVVVATLALPVLWFAVLVRHPSWGLLIAVSLIAVETLSFQIANVRVKPYQVALIGTFGAIGLRVVTRSWHGPRRVPPALVFPLIGVLCLSIAAHWGLVKFGLPLIGLQVLFVITIITVPRVADSPAVIMSALWCYVGAGAIEAVYGLLQVATFYISGLRGLGIDTYHAILVGGRPYGTFTEPDFFASFLAAAFTVGLVLGRTVASRRRRLCLDIALGTQLLCLALSLVRSAWIAVALTLPYVWMTRRRVESLAYAPARTGLLRVSVVVVSVVALVITAVPAARDALVTRAKNLVVLIEPENAGSATRAVELNGLIASIQEEPILGHGVGTYGVLTSYGQQVASAENREIGGVPGEAQFLGILFEEGVLGLGAFVFMLWGILRGLALRRAGGGSVAPAAEALLAGLLAATIAGMVNNNFYFGYFWVLLALGMAAISIRATQGSVEDGQSA